MHLQENTLSTRNIVQYPLQHVTCLGTKFEVAPSNGLGGDIFTRNVMDGRTDRRMMDKLWCEINIPFFLKKRADIIRVKCFRAT